MYDAIDPGTFDRQVVVQTYTTAKDSYGQSVKTWATYITRWASMSYDIGGKFSSNEGSLAGELMATTDIKWILRYDSGITEKMRIYYGSDYYYIKQVRILGRLQYLELVTEKRDND